MKYSTAIRSIVSAPTVAINNAEAAQAKIIKNLVCPVTFDPVEVLPLEIAGSAIRRGLIFNSKRRGSIFNSKRGELVGRIENFQIDFVRLEPSPEFEILEREMRAKLSPRVTETEEDWNVSPYNARGIRYEGKCIPFNDYELVAIEGAGALVSFEASGEIEILLSSHPWSGIVEISYGDRKVNVDLYEPHTDVPKPIKFDLGAQTQLVRIRIMEARNPLSSGRQCLFSGFRCKTGRRLPLRHRKHARVRGAEFNVEFQKLLAKVPPAGLLLDIGGGNRQIDDARYVNLDYANYQEPDLVGDATKLPFREGSIDAIYSSGVFEHIEDPFAAGAEVARVLKPGAKAVIGWAFMQPIHAEGQHFFNATPWGVERAFSALKVKRTWFDTSFASLVHWGASVSGLMDLVPADEIRAVCEILRRWDGLIPETRKEYMASGVWCELEKS